MQSTKNDLVHQVHYISSKHIQKFCFHVHFHFSHDYYKKSRMLKPYYPTPKTQKTTHIQLLCNYPLGITTTMQLSP